MALALINRATESGTMGPGCVGNAVADPQQEIQLWTLRHGHQQPHAEAGSPGFSRAKEPRAA